MGKDGRRGLDRAPLPTAWRMQTHLKHFSDASQRIKMKRSFPSLGRRQVFLPPHSLQSPLGPSGCSAWVLRSGVSDPQSLPCPGSHGKPGRGWACEVDWHSCPHTLPGWPQRSGGLQVSMGGGGPRSLHQNRSSPHPLPFQ